MKKVRAVGQDRRGYVKNRRGLYNYLIKLNKILLYNDGIIQKLILHSIQMMVLHRAEDG